MNIDNKYGQNEGSRAEARGMQKTLQFCMFLITFVIYVGSYYLLARDEDILTNHITLVTIGLVIVIPVCSMFIALLTLAPFLFFYIMTFASFIFAVLIMPSPKPELYTDIVLWAGPVILLSFVVFITYKLVLVRREYMQTDVSKETITRIQDSLTPLFGQGWIRRIAFSEIRMWYYCLYVWFKPPVINKEISFAYHKDSMIKVLIFFGCGMLLFDVGVLHFLIGMFSKTLAWIITISTVYLLLQFIAFYNSCRYEPHIVDDQRIVLRLGFYLQAEFSPDQIESIQNAKKFNDVSKEKGVFNCVLGLDSPQYEVILKESLWMTYMLGGREKNYENFT